MQQFKSKIITAEYIEAKDLLIFTIKNLESGVEQTYCWPPCDYLEAIGLPPKTKYEAEDLIKHCSDMLGKELNFVLEGQPADIAPKIAMSEEEIHKDCQSMAEEASSKLDNELKILDDILAKKNGL